MSLLRHKQRSLTALSPHQGNKTHLIPNRLKGYRELAWTTIPGQQFYTGIPAQVDFRQWLSGTNRQSATITAGDVYPAGFTFNNGVLSWDGTGNPSPGFEQSCIASDGEGPDTESGLFTISVVNYVPLAWSGPLNWNPTVGAGIQTFDVRAEVSGTNAATATLSGVAPLPAGFTHDGSVITYDGSPAITFQRDVTASDGIGPDAITVLTIAPQEPPASVDLVSQAFSINDKNGALDSRDPNYSPSLPFTVVDAQAVIASGEGGTAQIEMGWRPSVFDTDGNLFDLKGFRILVGTSNGNADIGTYDLASLNWDAICECKVTELVDGNTYWVGIQQINSLGVAGPARWASSVAAPARVFGDFPINDRSASFTVSSNQHYRLTAGFSGTITIPGGVSNVWINGQGNTISYGTAGVSFTGTPGGSVIIENIDFNPTSTGGTQAAINFGSVNMTGNNDIVIRGCSASINGVGQHFIRGTNGLGLGGARLVSNDWAHDARSGQSTVDRCFVYQRNNFWARNNTITGRRFTGRNGGYYNCAQAIVCGDNHVTFEDGAGQAGQLFFMLQRNTSDWHAAHNNLRYLGGQADQSRRMIFAEGGSRISVLHNTLICEGSTVSSGVSYGLRCRGSSSSAPNDLLFGFNDCSRWSSGSREAFQTGGNEFSASPPFPARHLIYHNNMGGNAIRLHSEITGPIDSFRNTNGSQFGGSSTKCNYIANSNEDEVTSARVESWLPGGSYRSNGSWTPAQAQPPVDGFSYPPVWQGYNPVSRTPAQPAFLRAFN